MTKTLLLVAIASLLPLTASAESFKADSGARQELKIATIGGFEYGETYVHTKERKELYVIAQLWRQRPSWTTITVDGHGYVAHDEEASIALGEERAERVRKQLIRFGVDPKYVVAVGHSRAAPGRYVDVTVEACNNCRR